MSIPAENPMPLTDAQLMERYRATERCEVLGELYIRYTALVYGVCLKYLHSVPDAEDAVLEIFESLPEKILRHEVREFRTWLYSVTRNHCLQQLRKAGRNATALLQNEPVEDAGIMRLLCGEDSREEQLQALRKCMERLPEPQRRTIRLFFWERKSYAEIADATTWHLKSIKSYMQNGKRNLRLCLESTKIWN